ncbi:hypothetical protein EJB05_36897, partial [Eragrostis curvula]
MAAGAVRCAPGDGDGAVTSTCCSSPVSVSASSFTSRFSSANSSCISFLWRSHISWNSMRHWSLLSSSHRCTGMSMWQESQDIRCPQLERCIKIAQLCVDDDQNKRPNIDWIIDSLNGKENVIEMASPVLGQSRNSSGLLSQEQGSSAPMKLLWIDAGKVHSALE